MKDEEYPRTIMPKKKKGVNSQHRHIWSDGLHDGSHCLKCGILRCQCWIANTHARAVRVEENCQVHGKEVCER